MGSKIKLTDTSGSRFSKKPKINESDLTVSNNELAINETPVGGNTVTPGGSFQSIQVNDGSGGFIGDGKGFYYNGFMAIGGSGTNGAFQVRSNVGGYSTIQYCGATTLDFYLPVTNGSSGNLMATDGNGRTSWTGLIRASNGSSSFSIDARAISDGIVGTTVDGFNRLLLDSGLTTSIDWQNRTQKSGGHNVINWGNQSLSDSSSGISVNWDGRTLWDGSHGFPVMKWGTSQLSDTSGNNSIDWQFRTLKDVSGNTIIDWSSVAGLIKLIGVPTYANDSAAAASGLTSGNLYKITNGGITSLNIVP